MSDPHAPGGEADPTAASRKQDHIDLAFRSRVPTGNLRREWHYEPLFSGHPPAGILPAVPLGSKWLRAPIWVSSMTGGTAKAGRINANLARACAEFGLGMGLGSCRQLLYDNAAIGDFAVRPLLGDSVPFYANLGIAQVEKLWRDRELSRVTELLGKLDADGLIVHINPLQEWMQPEGDSLSHPPAFILRELVNHFPELSLIVKEVGQGMGPRSLDFLLSLPLAAVEFAAAGGTNFSKLELFRAMPDRAEAWDPMTQVGHDATQMVGFCNTIYAAQSGAERKWPLLIISGGITDFLHGYQLIESSKLPAIYGQASAFLKYAMEDYAALQSFVRLQIAGLEMACRFLSLPEA